MDNNQDSFNKGGFIAFMFSILFCLAFFAYLMVIHPGVELQEVALQAEEGAEQTLAGGVPGTKVDVAAIEKPWEENPDMVAHGAQVYKTNCAVCHGPEGKGDGPAGGSLVPPPRNLVEGKWTKGGSSMALFKTIHDGIEGTSMASFAHLPVKDRWGLVQFIRSITQNKVPDDKAELDKFATSAK